MPVTRTLLSCVLFGLMLGGAAVASAEDKAKAQAKAQEGALCPICAKANDDSIPYVEKAGNTLARGALNAFFGWTELIRQPAKTTKEGGNVFTGVANGVGQGALRTLSGLGELFTFWTPKIEERYIHFSKDCPLDTTQ